MTAPSTPWRIEAQRIAALAWPVILTGLNWTILQVTDVIVVGLTGTEQVAALGASRVLTFIGIVVAIGWLSGILVLVSRADGAGDKLATGRWLQDGLAASLILGIVPAIILFTCADRLLLAIGVERHIAPAAASVVRVMAIAYPFQMVMIAASFFLEGISRPRRVTVVNLITLPINAVLAWAWATGHLGLPALGAVGAASATTVVSALGAIGMIVAVWTLPGARERDVRQLSRLPSLRGIGNLLGFGLVPAIASGLEISGFAILIALSTQLGVATAHAFQIIFSVHNVTFAVALGLSSAAGVRVGNAVGAGQPSAGVQRAGIAAAMAAGITGAIALLIGLAPGLVVSVFPSTEPVNRIAIAMLMLWAPFILFDAVQVVLVYALRSLGDQVMAGINSVLAYFILTGGLGWWLYLQGWGPSGLVIASGSGMLAAALLNAARLWYVSQRGWPTLDPASQPPREAEFKHF